MKNILIIIVLVAGSLSSTNTFGQKPKKTETIEIKTSAQCGMCKETIEKAMAFEKGVVTASLDVKTQVIRVTYKPKKTGPDKIRNAISKSGYDADEVQADAKAYEKLHYCCKKPTN